jgi:hypothetical protein
MYLRISEYKARFPLRLYHTGEHAQLEDGFSNFANFRLIRVSK